MIEEDLSDSDADTTDQSHVSYPPTQPATPISFDARAKFRIQFQAAIKSPDSLPNPLPIIAPPPYNEIPRAPASEEEIAECRIAKMIGREHEERRSDGVTNTNEDNTLVDVEPEPPLSDHEDEDAMDEEEKEVWESVARSGQDLEGGESRSVAVLEVELAAQDSDNATTFQWSMQDKICLEEDFRQEVVEWILDVRLTPLHRPRVHVLFPRSSHRSFVPSPQLPSTYVNN